jgi:predicted dehydrogenase
MTKDNVVIIGASGYWGSILTRAAIEVLGVGRVVALDITERSLELLTERLSAQLGLNNILSLSTSTNLDAVLKDERNKHFVIATPPRSHYQIAKKLLSQKRNIMLTKPIALSTIDAEAIAVLAEQKGVTALVDHTFLFNPAVLEMIKVVSAGAIGTPKTFYADWLSRGKIQSEVNVIWDLAPHPLSILLEFWKFPIEVSCKVLDTDKGVPTEASLFLTEQRTGNSASINVSWMDGNKSRTFKIRGSHNTIIFDDTLDVNEKLRIKGGKTNGNELLSEGYIGTVCDLAYSDQQVINLNWEEPLKEELRNFIEIAEQPSINIEKMESNTLNKGIGCVKLIEAAERSLQQGISQIVV